MLDFFKDVYFDSSMPTNTRLLVDSWNSWRNKSAIDGVTPPNHSCDTMIIPPGWRLPRIRTFPNQNCSESKPCPESELFVSEAVFMNIYHTVNGKVNGDSDGKYSLCYP
uniref:Uncharacterized protein n=1 Tax=Caenorhabditis japonica TaxID=281687 RepID=A0A8R1EAN2_CAEJA